MNTSRIKKILLNIFIIFMIFQPLLDIFYLYSDNIINIFKFSPSTIIRMIVMGLLFITSFLWCKNKRKYIYSIIFGVIFILYAIFHHYNSLAFESLYGNFTYSTMKELFYLIRMLMPLLLIFITYEKKLSFRQVSIIITSVTLIFSIIMIVTNLFEVAITSYNFGNKIIKANIFEWFIPGIYEKYGYDYIASKGIFHMANQISATFCCLLPINIYIYFKSKKNLNVINIFLLVISMLMLGTRIASYAWILIIIIMIVMYMFFEKNSLKVKKIILLILVLCINMVVLKFSPVMNRTYVTDEEFKAQMKEEDVDSLKSFIKEMNQLEKNTKKEKELEKIKTKKIKYVKDNYELFGVDETYIIDLYPYDEDTDFWLNEMTIPFNDRANHRQLKRDITKRVISVNNNKNDYIVGMSFTRLRNAGTYMENDIAVHLYSIGVVGIILFILPYAIIVLYALYHMFKNKENFNFLNMTYILSISIVFLAGILSGNVFDEWIVTLFLGFICGLLLTNLIKPKKEKRVLFISSTGGHLNELMQLKPLMDKYDSYIITEKTKSNISLKNKFDNVNYLVYGTKKNLFTYFFIFGFNIIKSFYYFIKIRPDVVVTTGTHTAVPMCYIGKLCGSKIIFIETFANSKTKTVAGKIVYPIADTFIVQWESMLELYPKAIYAGWIY